MSIKKLVITLLAIMLVFCLAACKQNAGTVSDNPTSLPSGGSNAQNNTTSGIELEEDVFDDDDLSVNPSSDNGASSQKNEADNTSNQNGSGNNSNVDSQPSGETSSEQNPTVEDGVIKLPVDWFD